MSGSYHSCPYYRRGKQRRQIMLLPQPKFERISVVSAVEIVNWKLAPETTRLPEEPTDPNEVLKYGLAQLPTYMFAIPIVTWDQQQRNQQWKHKVKVASRSAQKPSNVIVEGFTIMWVVHWPAQRRVRHYIDNLILYLDSEMKKCNVNYTTTECCISSSMSSPKLSGINQYSSC